MFKALINMFRFIRQEHISPHKNKDELYMEIMQSQLDELNRKVDEADKKLKQKQQQQHHNTHKHTQ